MHNPARTETLLTPVLGSRRAGLLASIAEGMDATLAKNPMAAALLGPDAFPAIAILYAHVLQATNEAIADESYPEHSRADAQATLVEIEQIVAILSAPDTTARVYGRSPGQDLIDALLSGRATDEGMPEPTQEEEVG